MCFSETLNDAAKYHAILLTKLVGELLCERHSKRFRRGKRRVVYSERNNPHHLTLIRISSYKYSSLLSGGKWMARPFDCLLYPLLPTSSYLSPIIIVSKTFWSIMKSLSWISYLGHLSFLDQSNLFYNETSLVLSAQRLILTRAPSEQPFKAMLL